MSESASKIVEGVQVGVYRLERQIGDGGFASVWEATHLHLKKRVAIKILKPHHARSHDTRMRFLAEGEAASRIRHPHVVDVTDVGVAGNTPYLVMELLEGEDLEAMMKRVQLVDERTAAEVMLPVIAGVRAAHEAGVLHRDVKPANIFLSPTPNGTHPKVLDFGISEFADADLSGDDSLVSMKLGTPCYMSPERVFTGISGESGDQYSLGVILYELVTGSLPFLGQNLEETLSAIKRGRFLRPRELRPDLDPEFEALVLRAMADDPQDRFQSVEGLALSLLPFARRRVRAYWEVSLGVSHDADVLPSPQHASELRPSERPQLRLLEGEHATTLTDEEIREALRHTGRVSRTRPRETAQPVRYPNTPPEAQLAPEPKPRRGGLAFALLALAVVSIVGAAIAVFFIATPVPEVPAVFYSEVAVDPPHARIALDGDRTATGRLAFELPRDGNAHTLTIEASGFHTQRITFVDHPPPGRVTLLRHSPELESVMVGSHAAPEEHAEVREAATELPPSRHRTARARRAAMEETPEAMSEDVAVPTPPTMSRQVTANGAPILD